MSSLPETRYSLLLRLQDASNDEAWTEFVELYETAVFRYVRSKGLQDAVSDTTWRAFWLTAVENQPPADVAKQLQLSIGAVYAAKCRVLQRLRDSVGEIDEDHSTAQDIDSSEIRNEKL